MNAHIQGRVGRRTPWRIVGWSIPVILLLVPLVAMRFTEEVNWSVGDFVFAALMFGITGLVIELTVMASDSYAYRGGVGAAVAASFLTVWANGAVGMIGSEDNPFNLLFFGVIAVALVGVVAARFRAAGMSFAMAAAAIAQASLGVVGMSTDLRGGVLSAAFAGLWLISAGLFQVARHQERAAPRG